ncbi:fibrobacter succinogenes major paralogous domain-containing protein [Flavobacteriales bacterium]|nr:fibrobacter succinogenes major paralogous domain-containing protein [Flavobacteriales bacterium]
MKKKSTIIALTLGTVLSIQAQNVGINTDGSDPDSDAILHINNHSGSSADSSIIRIENEQNDANDVTGLEIYNSGTGATAKWDVYIPASGSTDLRINNNGTDHVTIQNDGDVGIGTTTPISRLDIQGSMGYKINTINTTTTLDNTYNVVICNNGPYDVILPAAASNTGRVYYIKNNDSGGGIFTIDGNASETINGSTTYALDSYTHVVQIISDGTNWHIIEEANKNTGTITGLTCGSSTDNGTLQVGVAASGVSSDVPYTGGNNGDHSGQTVASTGVTGLTATLTSGSFNCGSGSLTYNITGTPASSGTASFALDIGGQTCTLTRTVNTAIATLDCAGATDNGTLTDGEAASGVNSVISYTGGNGAAHSGQTVTSTGVTGLTATLSSGTFASGAGTLTYNISGTPSGVGTASFAINIGGKTCTLERTVDAADATIPGNATCTGATISATPCSSVSGATINDNVSTTLGTEYDWTGATTSGMANTSTTQAIVDIGGQCWMRYNMNISGGVVYSGGPYVNEGRLYTWSAAMNGSSTERAQGKCPTGWHIPSDCEWMYLENTLGMTTTDQQATGARSSGDVASDLLSVVEGGTNNSGFSVLLVGRRYLSTYSQRNNNTSFWTSSSSSSSNAFTRGMWGIGSVDRNSPNKSNNYKSVRCLKD